MKRILSWILLLALLTGAMLPAVSAAPLTDLELTLDSIAWENLTYRNIFTDRNLAYVNGFDDNNWRSFAREAGNNTLVTAVCVSTPYSMKVTDSQRIMSAERCPPGDYFLAAKVSCVRHAQGVLGIGIGDISVGASAFTEGFVTVSALAANTGENPIRIGSGDGAVLEGYVDDPAVIPMDIFTNRPTEAELTALYEQYITLKMEAERPVLYTDQQMVDAFTAYMQKKAERLGMSRSVFAEPLGGYDNTSTARDMMTLMLYADSNRRLKRIWSASSSLLTVKGPYEREKKVKSKAMKAELTDHYHVLGGKTGTLNCCINLAVILDIPDSADRLAVVAMNANAGDSQEGNRYQAVKEIADAALMKYLDPEADLSEVEVCCGSALAYLLPASGAQPRVLFSKAPDTRRHPASMTKILNAICAMEILEDLQTEITYKQFDINVCPWYYYDFYAGDTMTLEDAISAMLLPSSNVTAFTIARTAGEKLLRHIHSYTASTEPPTCDLQGYTVHTCACGDSYTDGRTDALGHDWSPWDMQEPTYAADGLRTRRCGRCAQTEQEILSKLEKRSLRSPDLRPLPTGRLRAECWETCLQK